MPLPVPDPTTFEAINPGCSRPGEWRSADVATCGECATVDEQCLPSIHYGGLGLAGKTPDLTAALRAKACEHACDSTSNCVGFTFHSGSGSTSGGNEGKQASCLLHAAHWDALPFLVVIAGEATASLPPSGAAWVVSSDCADRGVTGGIASVIPATSPGFAGSAADAGVCYRKKVRDMPGVETCSTAAKDNLGVDTLEMYPEAPIPGQPLAVGWSGVPLARIDSGSVAMEAEAFGMRLFDLTFDLCSDVDYLSCPLLPGQRYHGWVQVTVPLLPDLEINVNASVKLSVKGSGGDELACWRKKVKVIGSGGGGVSLSPSPGPANILGCDEVDCGQYGRCKAGGSNTSAVCECDTLFRGATCSECKIPGHRFPDCEVPAVPVEKPIDTNKEEISIVWGIADFSKASGTASSSAGDMIGLTKDASDGQAVYDKTFDLTDPAAQRHVMKVCEQLRANQEMVQKGSVVCPLDDMRAYMAELNIHDFPFPSEWMVEYTRRFLLARSGFANDIALDSPTSPQRILYMRVKARSWVRRFGSGFDALPDANKWDELVDGLNAEGPPSANKAYQTAARWVKMWTGAFIITSVAWWYCVIVCSCGVPSF